MDCYLNYANTAKVITYLSKHIDKALNEFVCEELLTVYYCCYDYRC